jgi:hypothetical protein
MSTRHESRTPSAPPIDEVESLRREAQALLTAGRLDEATLAFGALAWSAPWCLDAWQGLAQTLQRLDCEPAASMTAALADVAATLPGSPAGAADGPVSPTRLEVFR